MNKLNIYDLSRNWFNWCFENPDKIKPTHTALYFFCIEHCNRLGWKEKFGLPTTMVMEAIGIKSYNTFINSLNDLVEFGVIKLIEKSKNQYSSNIIALSNFNKAHNKALDKAFIKHMTKQVQSTSESIDSIDIQVYNNTNIPINKVQLLEFVFLSEKEIESLKMKYGDEAYNFCIAKLNSYKGSTGKKYKSDYHTIIGWVMDEFNKLKKETQNGNKTESLTDYTTRMYRETLGYNPGQIQHED